MYEERNKKKEQKELAIFNALNKAGEEVESVTDKVADLNVSA